MPSLPAKNNVAIQSLASLPPILTGFVHRNHNQHRRAVWWSSLSMLRRHLAKFLIELEESQGEAAGRTTKEARKQKHEEIPRKKAKKNLARETTLEEEEDSPPQSRAKWLRDVLISRCYLAFSQLVADPQFAQLGVVLLGVLAQLRSACIGFVGDKDPTSIVKPDQWPVSSSATVQLPGERIETKTAEGGNCQELAVQVSVQGQTKHDASDWGEVVSREQVLGKKTRKNKSSNEPRLTIKKRQGDGVEQEEGNISTLKSTTASSPPPTKKRRKRMDAQATSITQHEPNSYSGEAGDRQADLGEGGKSRDTVLQVAKQDPGQEKEKMVKRKKKAKKGDAFDDLFKSLV